MSLLQNIEPKELWKNFEKLSSVPRPSKKEEKVVKFIMDFANNLGLENFKDKIGNVIIKKNASKGLEDRPIVILQSHVDMVCQKNNDIDFDFDTQGIKLKIDGEWVKADGTTLGADNGLGVASIMTILESNEIKHPKLECLLTIDEETGMTGALGLEANVLEGKILLNLDTEDDEEIGVGCAGGIDFSTTRKIFFEPNSNKYSYQIQVKGLKGGHSGMEIHCGYGNANILINRVLFHLHDSISIANINGGGLRNAIPRESVANVTSKLDYDELIQIFDFIKNEIIDEYNTSEPNIIIKLEKTELIIDKVCKKEDQKIILQTIYSAHNGVFRMSPDIANLVETSNNIARVELQDSYIHVHCLTRSSVESGKMDLVNKLKSTFELGGFVVNTSGSYPGWKPNPNSQILKVLEQQYENLFSHKPKVMACHAGLECGILGRNYPGMDMISFGPTILGAHSPDERANIKSAEKYWKFLLNILENI